MKKIIWALCVLLLMCSQSFAQTSVTTDLGLIFRDTARYFSADPGGDVKVDFSLVNYGTAGLAVTDTVYWGSNFWYDNEYLNIVSVVPPQQQALAAGDTIKASGLLFTNSGSFTHDTIFTVCYFLGTNTSPLSNISDINQSNDTICFYLVCKGTGSGTAIKEFSEEHMLNIFPNPAKDIAYIPLKGAVNKPSELSIYSLDGRLMYQQNVDGGKQQNIPADIKAWSKGMYFVKLQSEHINRSGRFVVE